MIRTAVLAALMAPLAAPLEGAAQEAAVMGVSASDILKPQLENSFITFLSSDTRDPLLFEAKIAPHFLVEWSRPHLGFEVTPKIVLRMFDEFSSPVRTPSFMPSVATYYWFRDPEDPRVALANNWFHSVSLSLTHHSNGQNGDFLNPDGSHNYLDGSFSTNFFEFSYLLLDRRVFEADDRLNLVGKVGFEWHPGFNQSEELAGRYGRARLNFRLSGVAPFLQESGWLWTRITTELTVILDDIEGDFGDRLIGSVTARYSPTRLRDIGLFASYHFGQDYYNIRFDRPLNALRLGVFVQFDTLARR